MSYIGTFFDPRINPDPTAPRPPARTTADPEDLAELRHLCQEGRIYEIACWIQDGRPLQVTDPPSLRGHRPSSALDIALDRNDHALTLLLLRNGYDCGREPDSPLGPALRARRWHLVDLLLEWGVDPRRVDPEDVMNTYQSPLFERFRLLGLDFTDGHALAWVLAEHPSNKPLLGWVKRHRSAVPAFQEELDLALGYHAKKGNEKGVSLCVWAGANPRARVPDLEWMRPDDEEEDDEDVGSTAIEQAARHRRLPVLELLKPDPELDDFDELYRAADSGAIVRYLASLAPPRDAESILERYIARLGWPYSEWQSQSALEALVEAGARWEHATPDTAGYIRRVLLGLSDSTFVDVMKLLAKGDWCAPEILKELGRTSAMRKRMRKVGFLPSDDEDRYSRYRPTRSREVVKKFGAEPPEKRKKKVEPRLPPVVELGSRSRERREVRLTREQLFERVWSTPVMTLAEEWGMSGRGLGKAC